MKITNFSEIVLVIMYRRKMQLKELAHYLGKSSIYVRQVIDGNTHGPKALEYRKAIASYLGIDEKYVDGGDLYASNNSR